MVPRSGLDHSGRIYFLMEEIEFLCFSALYPAASRIKKNSGRGSNGNSSSSLVALSGLVPLVPTSANFGSDNIFA